jgi:hypothetical protein
LFSIAFTIAQNNSQTNLYDWYDKEVGIENLDLNNGLLYYDLYPSISTSNRFLKGNEFTKGEVIYTNQYYNNIYLNYDLLNDDLLIKPHGVNDRKSIILVKDKIKAFEIEGRKFVNVNLNSPTEEPFIIGFYEEVFFESLIGFYVKHIKTKRQVLTNESVFYEFDAEKEFIACRNNQYFKINKKKSVQIIFPEYEAKINTFYDENAVLENSDKTLFFKKLFLFLESLTRNN